jgi:adenylate cyclase
MPADAPESGGGQATAYKASPDVFISYASQDKALADSVCEALERAGVVCWIAPRDVAPGEFYADAIVGAINTTRVMVLLLTENVVGSPHVLREIERASAKRHPVVTFRVEATTLPAGLEYFLSASHWLDATASGAEAALPKLGEAVRRLLAPVAAVEPRHHADTAKPPAELSPQRPMGKPSSQRLNRAIVATVAVIAMVVAYLFVDKLWFSKHAANERPSAAVTPAAIAPATPISDKSVAVMPFLDMSEKKDQEYFSDGMSEELIDKLARIPELRVPARTSSFYFKGKQATVSEIAKALSVAHVLEGSVRKSGNTLRVTTQLIRVDNGYHVWSETYDRQLTDVFKVQDEIAGAVVKALKVSILNEEALRAAQTTNPEAYETYLRANYYFDNFDLPSDLQKSIDYYRQAIKLDPNYAPTYAHMAQAYAFLAFFGEVSPSEGWGKAKEASSLAVQKDERLPEGHGALALAKLHFDWDFPGAEQEFKRALELNPNDADVRHDYAHYLMAIGRLADSEAESRRAVELDPVGEGLTSCLCWHSFATRDYDQSVRLAEKFLRSHPDDPWERTVLGWTYEQKRMPEQAIAQFKRAVKLTKGAPFFVAALAHAYAVAGNRREAEETLQTLSDRATKSYVSPFDLALIHAALGEKDKAFALLDKAVSERSTFLVYSKWEPRLDPLRSDPRFEDLLRQIGLGN